jgi:transcription antitermination factor NusG
MAVAYPNSPSLLSHFHANPRDGITVETATQPWFALQVRTRHEQFTAAHLRGKGSELFLPVYTSRRRWSDRIKKMDMPLFPGYLFCRFNLQNRLPILITPGVIQVVGIGKNPIPIEESEITAIQAVVRAELPREPWPFLQVGQKARIACGPLTGFEGVLLTVKGNHRLVLSVSLLKRSVAVELDSSWVSPISSKVPAGSAAAALRQAS